MNISEITQMVALQLGQEHVSPKDLLVEKLGAASADIANLVRDCRRAVRHFHPRISFARHQDLRGFSGDFDRIQTNLTKPAVIARNQTLKEVKDQGTKQSHH